MGKDKQDRRATSASSSAQAAEFLARGGGATASIGFGGFAGAASLGSTAAPAGGFAFGGAAAARLAAQRGGGSPAPAPALGSDVLISAQIDGEVAQCLRHLSKKDAVTKLKALQNLRGLIKTKSASDLALALPPWIYLYQRLSQDAHRSVRAEASIALGEWVTAVGKASAPHLKTLLGPWWLAQFDPYGDAASAARDAFQSCFPGRKRSDALLYCWGEVLDFLGEQVVSTAQQLGDPRRDSPEELEERYERVVSAGLLALAALFAVVAGGSADSANTAPVSLSGVRSGGAAESAAAGVAGTQDTGPAVASAASKQESLLWTRVAGLLAKPGFAKTALASKHALVRCAAYNWMREVCTRLPRGAGATLAPATSAPLSSSEGGRAATESPAWTAVVTAASTSEVASLVLGAVGDKVPGDHAALWGMLLSYAKVFPGCWSAVNMRKMFLPRLLALLRHGCYGSHATSWPALLPLLSLLPRTVTCDSPDVPGQVLDAAWHGLLDAGAGRAGRAAGCEAYVECCQWLLQVAAPRCPDAPTGHSSGEGATGVGVGEGEPGVGDVNSASGAGSTSADAYRSDLLRASLLGQPLQVAVGAVQGSTTAVDAAFEILGGLLRRLGTAGAAAGALHAQAALSSLQQNLASQATALVSDALQAAGHGASDSPVFTGAEQLVARVLAAHAPTAQLLAGAVMHVLVEALRGAQAGSSPGLVPAASHLLASLIREYGSDARVSAPATPQRSGEGAAGSDTLTPPASGAPPALGLDSLLDTVLQDAHGSPATAAHVQLVLSWLLSSSAAEQDWRRALSRLTGLDLSAPGDSALGSWQPSADVAHALHVTHSLATALATHVAREGLGTAPCAPWHAATDALVRVLGSTAGLEHATGATIMPVLPDGRTDVASAARELTSEPWNALLSTLLGGQGGTVPLVSPAAASQVLSLWSSVLLTAQPGAAHTLPCTASVPISMEAPACAALAVGAVLLAAPPPTSSPRDAPASLWAVSPKALAGLLAAVGQLAWVGDVCDAAQPLSYTPMQGLGDSDAESEMSEEGEGSEHGDTGWRQDGGQGVESEGPGGATALSPPPAYRAPAALAQRLEDQPWLALAVHIAGPVWGHGAALQRAASAVPAEQGCLRAALSTLASALHASLPTGSRAGTDVGAATAAVLPVAAHAQEVVVALAGLTHSPSLQAALLIPLLRAATAAAAATPVGTRKAGGAKASPWSAPQLLLAHVVHAVGASTLTAATADAGAEGTRVLGALVTHLACMDVSAGGHAPHRTHPTRGGGEAGEVVRAAVRDLTRRLARQAAVPTASAREDAQPTSTADALAAAQQLLYTGACGVGASTNDEANALGLAHYSASTYGAALLASLQLLVGCAPHSAALVERFCAAHVAPAATAGGPRLPHVTLQRVLGFAATTLRAQPKGEGADLYASQSCFPAVTLALTRAALSQPPLSLDPTPQGVSAVDLAVACFGYTDQATAGGTQEAADGGEPGAGHVVTSQESENLLRLLRHQAPRLGALAAVRRVVSESGAAPGSPPPAAPPAPGGEDSVEGTAAVARLQLAAAACCGGQLAASDWQVVLGRVRRDVGDAVGVVRSAAVQLCTALHDATHALLGAAPGADSGLTGLAVVQLLRQLDAKGVLSQHACYPGLVAAVRTAMAAAAALPAGLASSTRVLQTVLHGLRYCATQRTDRLPAGWVALLQEQRQACVETAEQLLALVLAVGTVQQLCATGGSACAACMSDWLSTCAETWVVAGQATCAFLDLSGKPGGAGLASAAYAALTATDTWLSTELQMGLHCTDALLSLALPAHAAPTAPVAAAAGAGWPWHDPVHALAAAAYVSVLYAPPSVTARLCLALADSPDELPEYDQGTDAVMYLTHAGLHPLLASAIGAPTSSPTVSRSARLAAWALLLHHLILGSTDNPACRLVRQALGEVPALVPALLNQLLSGLPLSDYSSNKQRRAPSSSALAGLPSTTVGDAGSAGAAPGGVKLDVRGALQAAGLPGGTGAASSPAGGGAVCAALFCAVLQALPATARTWFGDLRDRGTAQAVEAYTAARVSPALLTAELADVQSRGEGMKDDQFHVRVNPGAREVVAQLTVEEGSSLEIGIRLPPALPLKPPEVECRRRVGVSDTRMRKWLLSISAFLRTNNRGLGDAVAMWRSSVESEFAGVEPCLICYSVIAATNSALPRLQCQTCQVRFHPGCLYKWFKSSGKSACPHCQSPW